MSNACMSAFMGYTIIMFFLRNKKHGKWFNVAWSIVGFLVIVSMVLLYMPVFL
ncbi:MAG: hypothetical protein AAB869_00885 [Patescibacteria group bacterium]